MSEHDRSVAAVVFEAKNAVEKALDADPAAAGGAFRDLSSATREAVGTVDGADPEEC